MFVCGEISQVVANGTSMGTFEAGDELSALEAYAREAGYQDISEMLNVGETPMSMDDFRDQVRARPVDSIAA